MDTPILDRIRTGLVEKRGGLNDWLHLTPTDKKEITLGPSTEQAVCAHLEGIESSIQMAESGTLGLCEVCHETVETDLLEFDYTACVCIDHLSVEEIRHLETELELAQRVQKRLLPQEIPDIPGLEIAAYSRPAQIVGGDYFDFDQFGTGEHCLAIADVAGHGMSASLYMASIQAMMRSIVPVSQSPAEVVKQMHDLCIHNIRFSTFVTFFIGSFNPATKTFTYCNAGHNPPIALQKDKDGPVTTAWLNPTGAAIGLVEEARYLERTFDLYEEDLLVIYTDGVTEATNNHNEMFGSERLAQVVKRTYQSPPQEVIRGIRESLEDFSGGVPLADDTTLVVCRIT